MDFYPNFSIVKVEMLWVPTILKIKDCLSFQKPTIFKNTKQVKYQCVGTTAHAKLKTKVNVLMIQTITHVGINEFLSNSANLINYETVIKGIKDDNIPFATKATYVFHNSNLTPASEIAVNKK